MPPNVPDFPPTRWSLIMRVRQGTEEEALAALEEICRNYWYPVYAYLRRSGHGRLEAEDLTQGFFHRLIREKSLAAARGEIGRLRSFLLGVLKRHLSDTRRQDEADKRGGKVRFLSIEGGEARYEREMADLQTPDRLFDRAWAVGVIAAAQDKLRLVFRSGDNEEGYDHLREFLPLGANSTPYRKVARRMGVRESVVRLQVHRMRQRFRQIIEDEVRQTLESPAELDEELEHLFAMLSG